MGFARAVCLWLVVLLVAPVGLAQEAPYLTLAPREERVRQLELRGDLSMVRKRYLQAVDYYKQALELDRSNPTVLNKLGIAYHQLQDLGEAEDYYERAVEADENFAHAWNNLGTIRYAKEDYKDAIRYYRRALEANPALASVRSNLGTVYFARKKYDQAMEQYRLALLLDPEVFEHRSLFGILMQDHSVEDRARFYYVVAKSFATLGYVQKCLHYLRRALENGYPMEEAQNDPVFAYVSGDPRFEALFAEQSPTREP